MRLVEMEIARQDWANMHCGCGGSAGHLAEDLRRIARGESRQWLNGCCWDPVVLWEPAPAVASVALAGLADEGVPPPARDRFLVLLGCVVTDSGTDMESARRGLDLPALCQAVVAQGIWLLYREVMANRSLGAAGDAFEILTVVEPDRARLQRVRELAADWLPECCRTGRCDDDYLDQA
ncbi:hypothetical protein ACH4E7_23580 [Kitasatospora sp. NPDC018058]|uniref:hypothetical protein n=1 Tax=Kitasatospora sp. NPDC018058 TaxID=3364025 RepID=UPI0037C07684